MYSNNLRYRVKKIFASFIQGQGSDFRNRSGYTMLELMVAVAVIGILTSLAIAGSQALLPRLRLNSAAQQLHGDMQRCKMAAIRNNTTCLMNFAPGTDADNPGNYTACFDSGDDGSCSGDQTVFTRDLSNDQYAGVWLDNANFSGGSTISFSNKGMPDPSGSLSLLTEEGESRTLNASVTGRIKIQD